MFSKGDVVRLTGYELNYKVIVTKQHAGGRTFSGVIVYSELEGLEVGDYDHCYLNNHFVLEKDYAI